MVNVLQNFARTKRNLLNVAQNVIQKNAHLDAANEFCRSYRAI
jgi:hypothetical protein